MSDFRLVKQFETRGDLVIRPDVEGKEWMVELWASNAAGLEVNFPREKMVEIHARLGELLETHRG